MPSHCNKDCSRRWLHFTNQCSGWLQRTKLFSNFAPFTAQCKDTMFGAYAPGRVGSRCNATNYGKRLAQLNAKCCPGAAGTTTCDMGQGIFPEHCSVACSLDFGAPLRLPPAT